jgi:hypothetical protein
MGRVGEAFSPDTSLSRYGSLPDRKNGFSDIAIERIHKTVSGTNN